MHKTFSTMTGLLSSTPILISLLTIVGKLPGGLAGHRNSEGGHYQQQQQQQSLPSLTDALNVRIHAPSAVRVGDNVNLQCLYDLGSDSLYTMKWYRGQDEFFRYTPKESPPIKTFPVPGIFIDLTHSNSTLLTLRRADFSSAGRYSCEVTTDFPNVIAETKQVMLRVIAFPERKPEITILPDKKNHRFAIGDQIRANCTSYRSKPAANLTWLINGKSVSSSFPQDHQRVRDRHNHSLETSFSSILIQLGPQHFTRGHMRLACLAQIVEYYHQQGEVILQEEDRPKISSVVDNSSSGGSSPSSYSRNSGTSCGGTPRRVYSYYYYQPRFVIPIITILAKVTSWGWGH